MISAVLNKSSTIVLIQMVTETMKHFDYSLNGYTNFIVTDLCLCECLFSNADLLVVVRSRCISAEK